MESGILELYVLGQLNAQEQAEVEAMAVKYPEIKQELEAIEIAMEQYAQQQAVEPSAALKNKILSQISQEPAKEIIPPPANHAAYESKIRTLRIALAACASLLVVSGVMLYQTHHQLGDAKDQIASLNLEREQFTTTVSHMRQTNNDLQKIADMPNDPDWKVVKLAGTKMDPSAKMIVYWHISGRHVMVDNSKMGLPANDKAHQYQLWALVNGKPVDLGVFDVKADSTRLLLQMKEIASAQAFAVTLEKRGGSPAPTMDKMVVMGGVSI